jgi:bla regulator protein BlaR1
MAHELFELLASLVLAGSVAIAAALLLRLPLRRLAGADAAYLCWLMVPVAMLGASLPVLRTAPALMLAMVPQVKAPALIAQALAPSATSWMALALLAWAAGALVYAGLLAAGQRSFVRSLGPLTERAGVLVATSAVHGPALLGLWRPAIVVPSDFASRYNEQERALILAHERLHAERRDPLANAVLALLQCAFWFNPLMHIAASRFRFDQELACDAGVMARAGGQRQAYAAAMLKTQSTGAPALATCHWQSSHPLKERIMQLKKTPNNVRRRAGLTVVALLACASLLGTVAARAQTAPQHTYHVAFKFTAYGETTAPSVMVAGGEPFAVSSGTGKGWKGDFLVTEDSKGEIWLKSVFTLDGKRGGTHHGGALPGKVRNVSILAPDGSPLIVMESTVSRVKKAAGS